MMWTGIAQPGLQGRDHYLVLVFFGLITLCFVWFAIRLLIVAKKFPKILSEDDQLVRKRMMKRYGLVFGIEGAVIPLVCGGLVAVAKAQFILPAIALIVALHFFPMARLFERTIDYYLASWATLVALVAIYLTLGEVDPPPLVFIILGVGIALTTASYGVYMIRAGMKMTRN